MTTLQPPPTPVVQPAPPRQALWWAFGLCWAGGAFAGMDATMMLVLRPEALAELGAGAGAGRDAAIINALYMLGWAVGGVAIGTMSDRIGRVRAMALSISLYAVFTGLAGLAASWEQLLVLRFVAGMGVGGELVAISTYMAEIWPARTRAIAMGCLVTAFQAGILFAGAVTGWAEGWRSALFLGALPALLIAPLKLTLHESGRWQQARALGERRPGLLSSWRELARGDARRLWVGLLAFGGFQMAYWAALAWLPTWVERLPGVTAPLAAGAAVLASHGVGAIGGALVAGLLATALGRRPTLLLAFAGSLATSTLLFLTNRAFSPIIAWEAAAFGVFAGMAYGVLYLYLPELFPTRLRATATGLCMNLGRLPTAIAILSVGVLVGLLGGYAHAAAVFGIGHVVALAAALFGPETRDRSSLDDDHSKVPTSK